MWTQKKSRLTSEQGAWKRSQDKGRPEWLCQKLTVKEYSTQYFLLLMVIMKYLIFQNPIIPFSNINSGWQKTPLLSSAMLDPLQEILVVLVNRCPPGLSQDTVRSGFLALHSLSILECPRLWALWYLPLPSLPYLWLKFPEMLQRNFFFHILLWIGS